MNKCRKYIILKEIEDKDSLPIGTTIQLCNDVCSLSDGGTIPVWRLIRHGYIELLEYEYNIEHDKKDFGKELISFMRKEGLFTGNIGSHEKIKNFLYSNGYL